MSNKTNISSARLALGAIVLIVGFLSPLMIPWVTASDWSSGLKTVVSGLLAFGIPELFMLVAVAVMGKSGYEYIKAKITRFLKPLAPPDEVSPTRYRIGLLMFILPIIFGVLLPYATYFFPSLESIPITAYIISDLVFVSSFFILGGDFWDKVRGLFDHGVVAVKKEKK